MSLQTVSQILSQECSPSVPVRYPARFGGGIQRGNCKAPMRFGPRMLFLSNHIKPFARLVARSAVAHPGTKCRIAHTRTHRSTGVKMRPAFVCDTLSISAEVVILIECRVELYFQICHNYVAP